MSAYELAILGDARSGDRQSLTDTISGMLSGFGMLVGTDVLIHDGVSIVNRDRKAAFAAAYFGSAPGHADERVAKELIRSSLPIIPTVGVSGNFATDIPDFLRPSNGLRRRDDDTRLLELASALLECVGLLRRQRRVFISYRRVESRSAALQLHDLLGGRGFDVFLDTHDIRPAEPFQDVLWNRLCDSDVMIMLDTPTYFENRWTREELGRAQAKGIHVLRLVWPDHNPSRRINLAETIALDRTQVTGTDGPITTAAADTIVLAVEGLRSRSIASRYMAITGQLRAEVDKIGGQIEGIGAHHAISIRLPDDRRIWAYPIVGIPTSELLHEIADKARRADQLEAPVLVYDHIGISDAWAGHLRWLDTHIRSVRAVKAVEAGWTLAGWTD